MAAVARGVVIVLVVAVIALIAAIVFGYVDVSQTRVAELPKISIQGGQAPGFSVKTADVSVGSIQKTVEMPKVAVGTTSRTVAVPSVDVSKPR